MAARLLAADEPETPVDYAVSVIEGANAVLRRYGRKGSAPLAERIEVLGIERDRARKVADTLADTLSAIRADLEEAHGSLTEEETTRALDRHRAAP